MKGYTKKEKFEKRFQYSIAMAGILITLGYLLYNFIVQQETNIQQFVYTSDLNHIFILHFLNLLLVTLDAMLFTLAIVFVLCIVLNGIYIADILVNKWQKRLYVVINDLFRTGFIIVTVLIIYYLIDTLILCSILFILSFWIPLYTISETWGTIMMVTVFIIVWIIIIRYFNFIRRDMHPLHGFVILSLWFILYNFLTYRLIPI